MSEIHFLSAREIAAQIRAKKLSSREVVAMMEVAGAHSKVRSLGIFELNPEHDVADSTARVAATCAYHFIEATLGFGALTRTNGCVLYIGGGSYVAPTI